MNQTLDLSLTVLDAIEAPMEISDKDAGVAAGILFGVGLLIGVAIT